MFITKFEDFNFTHSSSGIISNNCSWCWSKPTENNVAVKVTSSKSLLTRGHNVRIAQFLATWLKMCATATHTLKWRTITWSTWQPPKDAGLLLPHYLPPPRVPFRPNSSSRTGGRCPGPPSVTARALRYWWHLPPRRTSNIHRRCPGHCPRRCSGSSTGPRSGISFGTKRQREICKSILLIYTQ